MVARKRARKTVKKAETTVKKADTSIKKAEKPVNKVGNHPPYAEMIKNAIVELKNKKGSNRTQILKFILEKYSVEDDAPSLVRANIIEMCGNNQIVHAKASMTGASGSFKLPSKNAGGVSNKSASSDLEA